MNTFSIGKCFNFGKMIPEEYSGSWDELMKSDQWKEFSERRQITAVQASYIKKGFFGLPMIDDRQEGNLFPFGAHKGKAFDQVPSKYWDWIEQQEWLEKWPAVKIHSDLRVREKKDSILSREDVASILQKIQ